MEMWQQFQIAVGHAATSASQSASIKTDGGQTNVGDGGSIVVESGDTMDGGKAGDIIVRGGDSGLRSTCAQERQAPEPSGTCTCPRATRQGTCRAPSALRQERPRAQTPGACS